MELKSQELVHWTNKRKDVKTCRNSSSSPLLGLHLTVRPQCLARERRKRMDSWDWDNELLSEIRKRQSPVVSSHSCGRGDGMGEEVKTWPSNLQEAVHWPRHLFQSVISLWNYLTTGAICLSCESNIRGYSHYVWFSSISFPQTFFFNEFSIISVD